MTTRTSTYTLRLPASLKAAVEKLSKRDGTSINQFVVVAVAEKIAAMSAEEVFAERSARADLAEFDRILNRKGGERPSSGDELPPASGASAPCRATMPGCQPRGTLLPTSPEPR